MKGRVLVVEDDHDIALGIRTVLARDGFDVAGAADGKQGLRAFHTTRPDLVILDIGLPALDGWGVLERIRDLSDVPVLILTAHGQETDKVRGLTGGADDYLTKPFGNRELTARVETLLRRPRASQQAEVYDDGTVQVSFGSHQVSVHGTPITLTPTEYRLLIAFVRNAGQILTQDQLLDLAWNDPLGIGPERVKFTVMRLRRKLGQGPSQASSIEAVRGFGYRYLPLSAKARLRHFATILHQGSNAITNQRCHDRASEIQRSWASQGTDPRHRGRPRCRPFRSPCPR